MRKSLEGGVVATCYHEIQEYSLLICKSFHLTVYWQVFVFYISTQPFSTTCNHHYKIISQGIGKFVACTPCLKCHVHNKLKGLRGVYVGIGSLVCIINLQITPVANALMRLGYQVKGTEDFSRQWLSQTWKLSSWKPYLCLLTCWSIRKT